MPNFLKNFISILLLERFSYYSLRFSLVLILKESYHLIDSKAYSIYSIFVALGYFVPLVAGILADKYLGYKRSVILGILIIILGMIILFFGINNIKYLYLSLALVAFGVATFRGSFNNLLSLCYEKEGGDRNHGFAMLHAGGNIGAICAALAIGFFANYQTLFMSALISIILCALLLLYSNKMLSIEKIKNNIFIDIFAFVVLCLFSIFLAYGFYDVDAFAYYLSYSVWLSFILLAYKLIQAEKEARKNMIVATLILMLPIFFFMIQMQLSAFIALFVKRCVCNEIFGYSFSTSLAQSINPFTVIFMGLFGSKLLQAKYKFWKYVFALTSVTFAFLVLFIGTLQANLETGVAYPYLFFAISIMAVGEIFIASFINAEVTFLSPENSKGFMMGMVMVAVALSNVIGIYFGKLVAIDNIMSLQEMFIFYQGIFRKLAIYNTLYVLICIPFLYLIYKKVK